MRSRTHVDRIDFAVSYCPAEGVRVNDVHSQLNETRLHRVVRVDEVEDVIRALADALPAAKDVSISVAGGRHAMGGQQFATARSIDMSAVARVLALDRERGLVTVEAGIQWPELIDALERRQPRAPTSRPGPSCRNRPAPIASASAARSPPTSTAAASR